MIEAPVTPDEDARLALLQALDLLDSPPEAVFDCATRTVARALRMPIALVSLIDRDRQWFKSRIGLDVVQTERRVAFCAHAILSSEPLVVEDTRRDSRFHDDPLVTGSPHIRFYAGMPIEGPGGLRVGTLCVADTRPRQLGVDELGILADQAQLLSRELQQRHAAYLTRAQADTSRLALERGEVMFRSVFEMAAVGVAIVGTDGRFMRVNRALCAIVGYTAEELVALDFQHITHPDDLDADLALMRQLTNGRIDHYKIEKRYITKQGAVIWIGLTVGQQRSPDGKTAYFISVIEDISERRRDAEHITALTANLEAQVAQRTQQLRQMVDLAQRRNQQLRLLTEATALLTASNNPQEIAAVLRQFMPRIYPQSKGALYLGGGNDYQIAATWGDRPGFSPRVARDDCWALRRCAEHRVEGAHDPLGCLHWHEQIDPHCCVPVLAMGEAVGLIEVEWRDIDGESSPDSVMLGTLARKLGLALSNLKLREELRQQALHDPLTGLYNRRHLDESLLKQAKEFRRSGRSFAILMMDLDHFKQLNDSYGHTFGDQALVKVAALLRDTTRPQDAAFRYGGEEFLLIVENAGCSEALQFAERIRVAVSTLVLSDVRDASLPPPCLSVSIGVAACPEHGDNLAALVCGADEALYAAKAGGRNCVRKAPPSPLLVDRADSEAFSALLPAARGARKRRQHEPGV